MAVPKRKQSPSRTGMRRSQNMKFSSKNIVEDKKSGEYRLSHHLDLKTGMYRGRQVLDIKDFYSFGSKTCLPRYIPVLRSRWCGNLYSPDFLSSTTFFDENFIF